MSVCYLSLTNVAHQLTVVCNQNSRYLLSLYHSVMNMAVGQVISKIILACRRRERVEGKDSSFFALSLYHVAGLSASGNVKLKVAPLSPFLELFSAHILPP